MASSSLRVILSAGMAVAALTGQMVRAQEAAAPDNGFKLSAQIEAGLTSSFESTPSNRVFGRLFDDQESQPVLNQLLLTAAKPIDPAATGYDVGFKLQGMVGTDARYTRFTNQFRGLGANSLYQVDLVEANLQLHAPWLSEGGVDLKLGQYATPIGAEVIDASGNLFYSHSYIFNFGIPLKHSGLLAAWHVSPMVDLYASLDTGINTGWGDGFGHAQNHGPPAFLGGVGFNLLGGDLTLLALTHIGTETPTAAITNGLLPPTVRPDQAYREIWDLVTTWKATEQLTLTNEFNWIHDDGLGADAYGVAQYVSWALNDTLSLNARGEIFVDARNALVGQYGANGDFLRAEEGLPAVSAYSVTGGPLGSRTTYGALTLGVSYKPKLDGTPISTLIIRPELREDTALQGLHPFHDGRDKSQTTAAIDVILGF
jgi:hypothetical protein